mmetsp:Transcript_73556/g.157644  ORF Transcript_73556/g.157644 Transcript_73556/m.157644 type:complete len:182 (-) Transcript_73556:105-650(-)
MTGREGPGMVTVEETTDNSKVLAAIACMAGSNVQRRAPAGACCTPEIERTNEIRIDDYMIGTDFHRPPAVPSYSVLNAETCATAVDDQRSPKVSVQEQAVSLAAPEKPGSRRPRSKRFWLLPRWRRWLQRFQGVIASTPRSGSAAHTPSGESGGGAPAGGVPGDPPEIQEKLLSCPTPLRV